MRTAAADPHLHLSQFGLERFRPGQSEVIDAVLEGEDVLCVMPTGGGKSLCYQLPSVARPGVTIVVSPLIALMKDQVDALRQRGMRATLINSSLTQAEQHERLEALQRGEYDLVYVAPERLRNNRFLEAIRSAEVTLLAVDEAHCISEWGHDFRPDYARLGLFRQRHLKGVQTIALTATATPTVRDDITRLLHMPAPRQFVTGFSRPNLRFAVQSCSGDRDKDQRLTEYLSGHTGSGIIYAATRKRCEELAGWLPEKLRRRVGLYHAGLDPEQRRQMQEKFMSGEVPIIVATNAFGMGIDKADLRFVVHYNMPGSLEAYYQEAGRAGRDGLPSECVLLFSYSDRYIQEFFIENAYPTAETVRAVYEFLREQPEDPIELTLEEVRSRLGLQQVSSEAIGTAETLLAKAGVLQRMDAGAGQAVLRIDSDLPTLVELLPREAKVRRRVMQAAEKIVGSRRGEDVYFHLPRLCSLAELERDQVGRALRELSRLQAFDYVPPFRGRAVHFKQREVPFDELEIDFEELERRKAAEYEKLQEVIRFAQTGHCRQLAILRYFGDPAAAACGNCDRCAPGGGTQPMPAGVSTADPPRGVDAEAFARGLRIVLSGVARTHGRFGKQLVAQMLCGSQNKKIQQWKLHRLSTYGLLAGLRQSQVSEIIDALASTGLLEQVEVEQRRPTVKLTAAGHAVMTGEAPVPDSVRLAHPLAKRLAVCAARIGGNSEATAGAGNDRSASSGPPEPAAGQGRAPEDAGDDPPADPELVQRLRDWRRGRARELGVPAYRILTNATLVRLAATAPETAAALEDVKGLGPATVEQFGYELTQLIAEFQPGAPSGVGEEATVGERSAPGEEAVARPTGPRVENPPPADQPSIRSPAAAPAGGGGPAAPTAPAAKAVKEKAAAGASVADAPDAYWTWRLLNDGYAFDEIRRIRRLSAERVWSDLSEMAEAGHPIDLASLAGEDDARVLRKVVAAGPEADRRLRALLPPHLDARLLDLARQIHVG